MKKALILGVTGQDGAFLSNFLIGKGYEIYGVTRSLSESNLIKISTFGIQNKITLYKLDDYSIDELKSLINQIQPNEIYNLASQSSVSLSFERPELTFYSSANITFNLLEAVKTSNIDTKIYVAGSGDCYGNTFDGPADETSKFNPRSPYGISKVVSSQIVKYYRDSFGLFVCTGILFSHDSSLKEERFVLQKIVEAARRISMGSEEIINLGSNVNRDWGYAAEYVESMWLMLQNKIPVDYIVATGKTNSLENFAEHVFGYLNINILDRIKFDTFQKRESDVAFSSANPSKIKRELNWSAKFNIQDLAKILINKSDIPNLHKISKK
jgi:GDPmannose 4,6-dehydratase